MNSMKLGMDIGHSSSVLISVANGEFGRARVSQIPDRLSDPSLLQVNEFRVNAFKISVSAFF